MKKTHYKSISLAFSVFIATSIFAQTKPDIEWINIPAGTLLMGSPTTEIDRGTKERDPKTAETQHKVTISAFKMSKYEVTFDQFDAYCEATGKQKPNDGGFGRGNRPVCNVTWKDATAFAEWIGCRLPTEAEWEYACRAGTKTPFNTGNNITTAQANYNGNVPYNKNAKGEYRLMTMPVGSFQPNAYGLYDMHGNIAEWCSDVKGEYPTTPQINPKGPTPKGTKLENRIYRGGCWDFGAKSCRSARRAYEQEDYISNHLGIRLVAL